MREQFDKELRDHIKDTFEVYDDDLAQDGWNHYRRKERNKYRKAFIMWSLPTGIAAAITFFLLINFHQSAPVIEEGIVNNATPTVAGEETKKYIDENSQTGKVITEISASQDNSLAFANNTSTRDKQIEEIIHSALFIATDTIEASSYKEQEIGSAGPFITEESQSTTNTEQNPAPGLFEEQTESSFIDISTNTSTSFAYTDQKAVKKPIPLKLKNVQFNVDVSTFMNFSKETLNNDVNLAVGVVSEYKLSKHFSINSGINLNRQTASYTHNTAEPMENVQNAMSLTNSIGSMINGHFTNAKLVGIDIPISFKYSAGSRKLKWFLSGGFSAYTLLNERYLNNFSVINYSFAGVETQNLTVEEKITDKPFSNFTLARTINFSTGITFPVKNITTLSVEPFVKYPLKTVGQERLDLGSAGVSFKMNLNKNLFKR